MPPLSIRAQIRLETKHAKVEIWLLAGCWPGFASILAL
jgi:hypothetical protein